MKVISKLDDLVQNYLHPLLRPLGFRRRARSWNRRIDDFTHVISVQGSRWNQGNSGTFTINVGIFVSSLYRVFSGEEPGLFAHEVDCVLRARIGYLAVDPTDKGTDTWWQFDSNTDLGLLAEQVAQALQKHGIPFLETNSSLSAIDLALSSKSSWETNTPAARLYLAITKHQLGRKLAANDILAEVLSSKQPVWRRRAFDVAVRLGIDVVNKH